MSLRLAVIHYHPASISRSASGRGVKVLRRPFSDFFAVPVVVELGAGLDCLSS
jgi:hypothetical protein